MLGRCGQWKIIAVWHWLLQLDWPAKGVVLALVLGIANLVLGIYNAWHARGADKRAAARERTAWVTDRIGDRHAELRPLLRTQLTALKCALTACEATAEAIKADQHDFRCPPSPFPDDALKETVAALDEMRLRLEHWQPQLVEAAVSRLKSLEAQYRSLDESFRAAMSARDQCHASFAALEEVAYGKDRFIAVSETWQTVSSEERDALKRRYDRNHEQMLEAIKGLTGPIEVWHVSLEQARDAITALITAMDQFERQGEYKR